MDKINKCDIELFLVKTLIMFIDTKNSKINVFY